MPDYLVRPANELEPQDIMLMANRYKIPVHVASAHSYKLPCYSDILLQTANEQGSRSQCGRRLRRNRRRGNIQPVLQVSVCSKNIDLAIPVTTAPPKTSIVANFLFKGIGMNMTSISDGNQEALMAVEAVLPTGELVHTGSWSLPISCKYTIDLGFGPQLPRLFVGALGTLGVVTKAAIKLWSRPKALNVKLLGVKKCDELAKNLSKVMFTKLAPNTSGGHWLLLALHGTNIAPYWGFDQKKKLYDLTDDDIVKMREYYGFPGEGTQYFYILACTPTISLRTRQNFGRNTGRVTSPLTPRSLS